MYGHLRLDLVKKKKTKSPFFHGFLCGNYQINEEKNHVTIMFLS